MPAARVLTEDDWLRERAYLQEHRYDLAVEAAREYPAGHTVAGTPLLAAPGWQPAEAIPLRDIALELVPSPAADGSSPASADLAPLPGRPDGTRYPRYSDAMRALAAPAVFENRPTYRLTAAELAPGASRLAFTRGHYFDAIDTGEAAAHEFAATRLGGRPAGLRAFVADPCDLRRRPTNLAISTLTLRRATVVDVRVACEWAGRLVRGSPARDDLRTVSWRGGFLDLLPGWSEDWVILEREHVRQRLLHALEALSRHLVKEGRYAEAVEAAVWAVSAGPLRESAIRVLIEAHLAEGNLIEARRVYQDYGSAVRRELGIDPGKQLAGLVHVKVPRQNRPHEDISADCAEPMIIGHS